MCKKSVLISFIIFFAIHSQAQNFTLSGRVQDAETKAGVQGATVVLKSISDTTVSNTSFTDSAGRFQFDQVQKDSFRITISFIGFETLTRKVKIDSANVDMGIVSVPKTSKELSGVTVTITTPPVQQKGDTVQINASQYKVNPDASAEDLVRKMPGITVDGGVVKAQGENVQKVTIDGRELFGDDATAALRNLPAEIIDKIQVFDRLSDQAQVTGIDDGNTQKGINIITKANMRNGQFGRVYAGYGSDERYQAGGNATFLKENRKIALVGNFNNVNQQNFSQQDLLGVTSSNNNRGGQGGGGGPRGGGPQGGGGPRGGGGGNPGGGQGNFGNNSNFLVGQQNGTNKTNAVGINYSDLWGREKIITISGSYFFNNTNNTTDQLSTTEYFLEGIPDNKQSTQANSRNNNHRFNMRFEYRIDSSNQLTISPNLSFQDNSTNRLVNTSSFRSPTDIIRETNNATNSTRTGNNLNNSIFFRHSFPKRGRTFSINLNTSFNRRVGDTYVTTQETEYNSSGINDTTTQRFTDQINGGHQISTNLVYAEPLGENSQLQFNYNPSFSKSSSDQQTFGINPSDNKYSLFLDSLSNKFENKTRANNAGISYRYGNRDRQISFGVNYQQTKLFSDQTFPETLTVNKTFQNFLPNAQVRYKISPKSSIRFNYRSNTNQPSVTQLQNVVDPTNAPFFTAGNPDLEQQYMHILSTQYTYTNTQKALLFVANVFAQRANNYITNATFAPTKDSVIGNKILL
ncbi:MAG: TonB-dependent receptor domain-containing protein, partial [Chitinophagaceae bacterium]